MARDPINVRPNRRVANDRFTGFGVVQPGSHNYGGSIQDREDGSSHAAVPTPKNFFSGIADWMRGAKSTRDSLANSQADRRSQLQGERDYYNNSPSKTKGTLAYRGGRARG